jgi:hypothetical protein
MTCLDYSLSNAKMSFVWYEDTGLYQGSLTGTSKNPRVLTLAGGTLDSLTSYSFTIVSYVTDMPSMNNSATVTR